MRFSQLAGVALWAAAASAVFAAEFPPNHIFVTRDDGVYMYAPDGSFVDSYTFASPSAVAFGPRGHLYVSTPTTIWEMDVHGVTSTTFTVPNANAFGGIAFGPLGRLFATHGDRIYVFDDKGNLDREINPFPPVPPGMFGITISPDGHIWVTNVASHEIIEIDPSGTVVKAFGDTYLDLPAHLIFGPDGTLYATSESNSTLFHISPVSGTVLDQTVANNARGIVYGGNGVFYVADGSGTLNGFAYDNTAGFALTTSHTLSGAGLADGIAISPFRFKVRATGKFVFADLATPTLKVKDFGTLSYTPGGSVAILEFSPQSVLSTPTVAVAKEATNGTRTVRFFDGLNLPETHAWIAYSTLWLQVKGKVKNNWFDAKKVSGTLRVTDWGVSGNLKIKHKKRLN